MKASLITAALAALAASQSVAASPVPASSLVAGFEELALAPSSYFFPKTSTTFASGPATFNHTFTDFGGECCHVDWVYSNMTDTTTGDFTNQHSAVTGGGANGSSNYAIANFGTPVVTFSSAVILQGAYFTNTTFAALTMINGDAFGFSKKFGGASGNDADYFSLSIIGKDAGGATTGSIDFMLADYRFADNSQDYVVTDWRWVDLSALGSVSSLQFALASSDTGAFGINTPAYFALDSLTVAAPVPEPGQMALLLAGLAMVGVALRRQR